MAGLTDLSQPNPLERPLGAKVQEPAGSDVELRKQALHRCFVTIESFDLRWPELLDLDHDQFIVGPGLGCFVGSKRRLKV